MSKNLTSKEKKIIHKFVVQIRSQFPEEIKNALIFGSKARGEAGDNSDIDLLVITKSDNWKLADRIRRIGYELDDGINYKFSIQVIPENKINYMIEHHFQFIENVFTDAITV
jgi:predicted nucleotidyltransferase